MKQSKLLSICITTYNRGNYLKQLLLNLNTQLTLEMEIIIVDGGSIDDTHTIAKSFSDKVENIKFINPEKRIGLDEGFDIAVRNSQGKYCWFIPDDDILESEAISKVMGNLHNNLDLLLINMKLMDIELNGVLQNNFFEISEDKIFKHENVNAFFSQLGWVLSYVGSLIIRRSIWTKANSKRYYGSYFIHVGVVLERLVDIKQIKVLKIPLIRYRSGNVSWGANSFEIWYKKWPCLIWKSSLDVDLKKSITSEKPWRRALSLVKSRGMGEYNYKCFKQFILKDAKKYEIIIPFIISFFPERITYYIIILYLRFFKAYDKYTYYELRKHK